jgi:hypothetical protein
VRRGKISCARAYHRSPAYASQAESSGAQPQWLGAAPKPPETVASCGLHRCRYCKPGKAPASGYHAPWYTPVAIRITVAEVRQARNLLCLWVMLVPPMFPAYAAALSASTDIAEKMGCAEIRTRDGSYF